MAARTTSSTCAPCDSPASVTFSPAGTFFRSVSTNDAPLSVDLVIDCGQ
ncbi:Uncharacterised protein [Mycobacteroides abscessus subsp. massiliense]|nr:Uncharacterised protein [Mycobacteroides abscessus subsp. massiliense]